MTQKPPSRPPSIIRGGPTGVVPASTSCLSVIRQPGWSRLAGLSRCVSSVRIDWWIAAGALASWAATGPAMQPEASTSPSIGRCVDFMCFPFNRRARPHACANRRRAGADRPACARPLALPCIARRPAAGTRGAHDFRHDRLLARDAEAMIEFPAGLASLGQFDQRLAQAKAIADAHIAFDQPARRDVLAERTRLLQQFVRIELLLPIGIMVERIMVYRDVRAAMVYRISHLIALETQLAQHDRTGRRLARNGAHRAILTKRAGLAGEQRQDADRLRTHAVASYA